MKFLLIPLIVLVVWPYQFSRAQLNPFVIPPYRELKGGISEQGLKVRRPLQDILKSVDNELPNIVLVGYWPPTNEMLREFSPHKEQNPKGWIGKNWKSLGYNVYAFFPEFKEGLGKGSGDFQVDYQNTKESFWRIVPTLKPVALMAFGRAYPNTDWEIEERTYNLRSWYGDYLAPFRPEPSPPNPDQIADAYLESTYPGQAVVKALKSTSLSINPFLDANGAGGFLCEYLGYHLSWYQLLNPQQVQYAAFTHLGSDSKIENLKKALYVNLSEVIAQLKKN